jgi:hypothetical protein
MRTPTQASNCVPFKNGLAIKGSYAMSQGGTHVNLYLINCTGHILASRSYAVTRNGDPPELLKCMIGALKRLCDVLKLDEITQPRIQEAASKTIMETLTKQSVFKNRAA